MGYTLTIDQGNSAVKAVVWLDDAVERESAAERLEERWLDELIGDDTIDAVMCCSVRGTDETTARLLDKVAGRVLDMGQTPRIPIAIGYDTPRTLGKDRIAAAVGAWTAYGGRWLLVVDMGTAITYDLVSPDGEYVGGNIAPGVEMRLDALHAHTAKLPRVSAEGECPLWGHDTETALRAGVVRGIVGELTYYRSRLDSDAVTVLTGGSAELIAPLLPDDVVIERQLVNKGLNCILRYNENR